MLKNKEKIEELLKELEDKIEYYNDSINNYIKNLYKVKDYIGRYYKVDKETNGSPSTLYKCEDYSVIIDKIFINNINKYIDLDAEMFDCILVFEDCRGDTLLIIDINKQTFSNNVANKEFLLELLEFDVEKVIIDKLEEFREEYL